MIISFEKLPRAEVVPQQQPQRQPEPDSSWFRSFIRGSWNLFLEFMTFVLFIAFIIVMAAAIPLCFLVMLLAS